MRSAHSHPTAGCACMGGLTIKVKRPLNISRGGIFPPPQIAAGRGAGEKWRTIGSWCTFAKWIKIFQQKPFKSGYAQAEAGWAPIATFCATWSGLSGCWIREGIP